MIEERVRLLEELLAMTEAEDFSQAAGAMTPGEEEEAVNRFAVLYAKRAGVVRQLEALSERIKAEGGNEPADKASAALAEKIVALDKKNAALAEKLTDKVKARLKELKSNRSAAAAYHNENGLNVDISLFDESH